MPERTLIFVAAIGGVLGAGLGMLIFRHKIRKRKFYITIPVLLIVYIFLVCFFLYQNHHLVVTRYTYKSSRISDSLNGYKIVQISDLHNQYFGSGEEKLIEKIRELSPDVIYVTGDVVDRSHTNYGRALDFFRGAVNIAPVYYITGNHEQWLRKDDPGGFEGFIRDLKDLGVQYIDDEEVQLDGYKLIGVSEDRKDEPAEKKPEDEKSGELVICIAHEPKYHEKYKSLGADLTFTGHIHGGQIILPWKGGLLSPDMEFFPELYEGVHTFGEMTMVISRGLGNSVIPIRLNNYPEIIEVVLEKQ